MDTAKKDYYKQVHEELANKYATSIYVINHIRSSAGEGMGLQEIIDKVEERIARIQHEIELNLKAIEKRTDPAFIKRKRKSPDVIKKMNLSTRHSIEGQLKKKGILLDYYTFLHKLNDSSFADIIHPVEKIWLKKE